MDNKTSRFLLSFAAVVLAVLVLGQFFMYPISGKDALWGRLEKSLAMFEYERVVEADLDSSVIYILKVDGKYVEKMFDKSIIFERYVEKPLVLLQNVDDPNQYEFVARDSASDILYSISDKAELRLLRQSQSDVITIGFVIFGSAIILMGLFFGKSSGKKRFRG